MANQVSPQPFDTFLESLESARYDQFRALPGAEVESASAFEDMRGYLQNLYRDVRVVASFVENDGQIIDCIAADQHPAVKRSYAEASSLSDPAAQPVPRSYETTPPSFASRSIKETAGVLPRTGGRQGADTQTQYPPGTLPMYRSTLEQLSRFKNLSALSAKDQRFVAEAGPATSVFPKRYATGEQDVDCLGGGSHVNVWKPFATPSFQATFSQQWHLAGHDGTLLQTVECGWHIDKARYGNDEPHLFVYSTRQNYDAGHSFFNLDGGVYQPFANPYVLPGAPLFASQTDGTQITYHMGFYLTGGAWVFYFDGHPVGRYPLAWFNNGPLTSGAKRIKFGGEVGTGIPVWPAMGSGNKAAAGFGKAAYQRAALVYPMGGGAVNANLAEAGSVTGTCYTIDITNNSASDWGTYLFFGGPGGTAC